MRTRGRYESAGGRAVVVQADAGHLPLLDGSVDLIVTSPPYFSQRSYKDNGEHYDGQVGSEATSADYLDSLVACTADWLRVLKASGSIWVNLGDKYARKSLTALPWRYAIRCLDELPLLLRAEIIWSKPNGLPESVTDRVRRSHETWFHFTKEPRYFAALDGVREPYLLTGTAIATRRQLDGIGAAAGGAANIGAKGWTAQDANPLGKIPSSVWTIPTQPLRVPEHLDVDHFAAFPMEWPRRIIKGWSPDGGIVLDPFGGSGTTALVASALGRTGISVDLSHDYSRLGQWRTTDPAQRAKAAQQKVGGKQRREQDDLFGGVA